MFTALISLSDQTVHSLLFHRTFHVALVSFRDAVLRYAYRMRKHYTHRKHTNLTGVVPEKDRLKYDYLIKIAVNGTCALTPAFQRAIDNAAQHSQRQ